jgi:hypothetical protein
VNKKGYNQLLAMYNSFKWLYDDLSEQQKTEFVDYVESLILNLCINEYQQYKNKPLNEIQSF